MSSSIPARHPPGKGSSFFWIHALDTKGNSIDEEIINAAYAKAVDFRLYRAYELTDEAVRADLVEDAVDAVSTAEKSGEFRDVTGYLISVFKRLVDLRIWRDSRENSPLPSYLRGQSLVTSVPPRIEEQVYCREVLDVMKEVMDEETLWAWERKLFGYKLEEIASDLNVSADRLSTRLRRARDAARKRLSQKKR